MGGPDGACRQELRRAPPCDCSEPPRQTSGSPGKHPSSGALSLPLSLAVQDRFSTSSLSFLRAMEELLFAGKLDAGECGLQRGSSIKSIWACDTSGCAAFKS